MDKRNTYAVAQQQAKAFSIPKLHKVLTSHDMGEPKGAHNRPTHTFQPSSAASQDGSSVH